MLYFLNLITLTTIYTTPEKDTKVTSRPYWGYGKCNAWTKCL